MRAISSPASRATSSTSVIDELHQDDAVARRFGFRADQPAFAVGIGALQALVGAVFRVELIDIDDFFRVAERAAADRVAGVFDACRQVVFAEMVADRGEVIGVAGDDRVRADAALAIAGDAVAVALGVLGRVDEKALLDGCKIAANLDHFFQEGDGPVLDVADHLAQRAFQVQAEQLLDPIQGGPGLLDGLDAADVVVVPGHVAAFIRRDRALDVGAGQHRDQRVDGVGADGFFDIGFDIAGVLLGAHLVFGEEIAQRHRVGQVVPQLGGGRRVRRDGGQADQVFVHPDRDREGAVDAVLDHQLGHHQPAGLGGGVGVVGAVDLEDPRAGHHALGFGRVHKRAVHVDVAVEHVVLRVLVGAVDAFFGEQHGHFRSGHAGDIAVEVDRAADFFFDQVAGFAAGADLLAGDRHAAGAFGRAFHQPVDVALPGGADDHHVVGAVPGGHAHAAEVVLEAPGGDLGGDHAAGLRVDVVEILGGRQADAVLERAGHIPEVERAHLHAFGRHVPPDPALAGRMVALQVLQDRFDIELLVWVRV